MSDLQEKRNAFVDALARWYAGGGDLRVVTAPSLALVAALDAPKCCDHWWVNTAPSQGLDRCGKCGTTRPPIAPSEPSPVPEAPFTTMEIEQVLRIAMNYSEYMRDVLNRLAEKMSNANDTWRSHEEMAERVRTLGMELERVRESARSSNERLREQRDVAMKSRSEMAERVRRAKAILGPAHVGRNCSCGRCVALAALEGRDKEPTSK